MRVLEWGQFPLLDHTWEQRLIHGDTIEVYEKGGEHCLLTFNWIEELDVPTIHVSDCPTSWLHRQGMRTAIVSATPFKCLQLDRGYLVHDEALRIPDVQFEEVIQVPIFDGNQLPALLGSRHFGALWRQAWRTLRGAAAPRRAMD